METVEEYIRVYKEGSTSYLCRRVRDHFEIEAEGNSASIQSLVDNLNRKGRV